LGSCSGEQNGHAFARGSLERQRRMNSVINWLVALSLTFQWLASTVCAPAMRKARRNDITPSPIFTSPVPLSQALRMTNSVPCKFNSDASKPVSSPSSATAFVIWPA
jgi:hypothetical protein